jgi:histidine triad (HIT) family protein
MSFTPEESAQVKEQIIKQVEQMPGENNKALIEQIGQLDDAGLDAFLSQNNIEYKDGQLMQTGQSQDGGGGEGGTQPAPDKPIFESIIKGELPSYKIAENDKSIAILEINPLAKGHCIILPKKKSTIEKIPKSALTLAQKLAKRIKLKLKPDDIKIETFSFQDYPAINIIPIWKDKQLQKYKEEESELKKMQKKLVTKTRAKRAPKPKSEKEVAKIKSNLPEVKGRLPY